MNSIDIMGAEVDAFVVEVDRQTQPGSTRAGHASRKYWLDPVRAIWVKWEEHLSGRQDVGPRLLHLHDELHRDAGPYRAALDL